MNIESVHNMLQWAALINLAVLCYWFFMLAFAHDFVYRMHSRWFKVGVETFDAIHYAGLAFYKIMFVLFNLAPLLALYIIR